MPKMTIITISYNAIKTIKETIDSVLSQSYRDIEYILVDGKSTDGTRDIVRFYGKHISKFVSEPDNGIYDAMNKGLKLACGDIIGTLNSDDVYADNSVIKKVISAIEVGKSDSCYGDLVYVDADDVNRVVRYWQSGEYFPEKFEKGWMPPHPTFFVKRIIYEKYGIFNTAFPIAADYELMLRFLYKYGVSTTYIPQVLVKMRTRGRSRPSLINTTKNIMENYKAWKINKLNPNPVTFLLKPLSKALQYLKRAQYF